MSSRTSRRAARQIQFHGRDAQFVPVVRSVRQRSEARHAADLAAAVGQIMVEHLLEHLLRSTTDRRSPPPDHGSPATDQYPAGDSVSDIWISGSEFVSDFDIRIWLRVGVEPRFCRRDFSVQRFAGDRLRPTTCGQRKSSPQDATGVDDRQSLSTAAVFLLGVVVVCHPDSGVRRTAAQRGHHLSMEECRWQVKSNGAFTGGIFLRYGCHPCEPGRQTPRSVCRGAPKLASPWKSGMLIR